MPSANLNFTPRLPVEKKEKKENAFFPLLFLVVVKL